MDELKLKQIVGEFAAAMYQSRKWQIEQMLLGAQVPHATTEQLLNSGEAQEWLIMARAGAGLMEWTETRAGYVYEICQGLAEWLFALPDHSAYHIPDAWKDTTMGQLWWRAFLWSQNDELITISEAAALAGVTVAAIGQSKKLDFFVDPDANERQGKRLVRKKQVQEVYGENKS